MESANQIVYELKDVGYLFTSLYLQSLRVAVSLGLSFTSYTYG